MKYTVQDYELGALHTVSNSMCYCCMLNNKKQLLHVHLKDEHGDTHIVPAYKDDGIVTVHADIDDLDDFSSWLSHQDVPPPTENYDYSWFFQLEHEYGLYVAARDVLDPWIAHYDIAKRNNRIDIPVEDFYNNDTIWFTFGFYGVLSRIETQLANPHRAIIMDTHTDNIFGDVQQAAHIKIQPRLQEDYMMHLYGYPYDARGNRLQRQHVVLGAYPGVISFHFNENNRICNVSYQPHDDQKENHNVHQRAA